MHCQQVICTTYSMIAKYMQFIYRFIQKTFFMNLLDIYYNRPKESGRNLGTTHSTQTALTLAEQPFHAALD